MKKSVRLLAVQQALKEAPRNIFKKNGIDSK